MKRRISTILCASVALGAIALGVGFSSTTTFVASAEETSLSDELVMPSTYEQYLPLKNPSDVAMTGGESNKMIAIADGDSIHVYNHAQKTYSTYDHTSNSTIEKLQFSGTTLYFSDGNGKLHTLNPYNLTATQTEITCSTFFINGPKLYYSLTVEKFTKLYEAPYDETTGQWKSAPSSTVDNILNTTTLTSKGNSLYYIHGGTKLVQQGTSSTWELPTTVPFVSSVTIVGNYAYYTSMKNNQFGEDFYVYDLNNNEIVKTFERGKAEKGYGKVSQYNNKIYVVKGQSICEFDPETNQFTGYEIGASSPSENRLIDAKNSVLHKGILYTLDKGRISIYDTQEKTYKILPTNFDGDLIATDGKSVLLAKKGAYAARLYGLDGSETSVELQGDTADGIVGITCVYGQYYYVTNDREYGKIHSNGDTEKKKRINSSVTPVLLSSDAQGYLYVLTRDNKVYRMTESAFFSTKDFIEIANGTNDYNVIPENSVPVIPYHDVPNTATKLLVDYEQNVYAIVDNNEIKAFSPQTNEAIKELNLSKTLAYTQTANTPVTTVAFDVETAEAYVLYDGNLMIKTYDLKLPCMSNIKTNGIDKNIFEGNVVTSEVVTIAKDTLLVEFDLDSLPNASIFPYKGYMRTIEEERALVLGRTGNYAILAVYGKDHKYHAYLAQGGEDVLKPDSTGETTPDKDSGYLSNSVNLYKFPYLNNLLTVTQLPKNQKVTILGKITVDYEYYHVKYTVEGEPETEYIGYIPTSFVNDFESKPPHTTYFNHGVGAPDATKVWSVVFILLGCSAIIILIDYLLLRKNNKED